MKYNKCYSTNNCQNSMNTRYTVDKDNYVSNNYPNMGGCEAQEIVEKEECCEMDLSYNKQNNCNNNNTCSCNKQPVNSGGCSCNLNGDSNKVCSNCNNNCNCCKPYECDMNSGKIEGIRTIIKRLFSRASIESCPVSEELQMVDGSDFNVSLDLIERDCECECPPIDINSKFTCNCVKVDIKAVELANIPEIKLNGKELVVTGSMEDCYIATIEESMLNCPDQCMAEKAHICIRAEGWSIDATYMILGCVVTGGKVCDFKLTITTDTPIEVDDNTVFYMKEFCAASGELKLCFDPKVCLKVDSIIATMDGTSVEATIKAILGLEVAANLTLVKEQEVCIQGIVIG